MRAIRASIWWDGPPNQGRRRKFFTGKASAGFPIEEGVNLQWLRLALMGSPQADIADSPVPEPNAARQAILAATRRVAERDGILDLSLLSVAQEAGVAPGSVYGCFNSKNDLLICVIADDLGTLAHAMRGDFDSLGAAGVWVRCRRRSSEWDDSSRPGLHRRRPPRSLLNGLSRWLRAARRRR